MLERAPAAGRAGQLDSLRALAVAAVLYTHFADPASPWGHVGVRLFFVLSGFLITGLLLDLRAEAKGATGRALAAFYGRRALRILPAYLLLLTVVAFVDPDGARSSLGWHAAFLSNFWFAGLDAWRPWPLGHLWTLSIEAQFYLVWPLVVMFAPLRRLGVVCITLVLASILYRFVLLPWGRWPVAADILPPAAFDVLAAGALLAVHRAHLAEAATVMRWPAAILAAGFLVNVLAAPGHAPWAVAWLYWFSGETFMILPLALAVASAALGAPGLVGRLLDLAPLRYLGRISYGIYLYHFPMLWLWLEIALPAEVRGPGLARLALLGAAAVAVAAASWHGLERPLNSLKRRLSPAPGAPVA